MFDLHCTSEWLNYFDFEIAFKVLLMTYPVFSLAQVFCPLSHITFWHNFTAMFLGTPFLLINVKNKNKQKLVILRKMTGLGYLHRITDPQNS